MITKPCLTKRTPYRGAERVGRERPFCLAEVWEGRTAVCVSLLSGRAGADVVGKRHRQEQRFCRLWRGLVGKGFGDCETLQRERPVLSTRVMEGKRPFSCNLLSSSQRRFWRSQFASAQRFNNFTQESRPRRWSGVPPNIVSRR
jgi:hypothetical protein